MTTRPPDPNPGYLRPLNALEIIGAAAVLFRDHVALLVTTALLPYLILLGLSYLLVPGVGAFPEGFYIFQVAGLLIDAYVMTALTVGVTSVALGDPLPVRQVYRHAFGAGLLPVLIVYVLVSIMVISGFLFLFFPGLILGGLFAPAIPSAVLEGLRPLRALNRAIALMRGQLMTGVAVFSFFILISGFLPLFLFLTQSGVGLGPFSPLLSIIIRSVTLPLGFTASVLLYFSLRVREDPGFGPQRLAEEIAAGGRE